MKKFSLLLCFIFVFSSLFSELSLASEHWKEDLSFLQNTINNDYPFLFKKADKVATTVQLLIASYRPLYYMDQGNLRFSPGNGIIRPLANVSFYRRMECMSDSALNITVESLKHVDLIVVAGRFNDSNVIQFDNTLNASTGKGRHNLVLELSGVNYMNDAGIRSIISALRKCKKNRGDIRLANISRQVSEALELTGLSSLFQIYDDVSSAVGSF